MMAILVERHSASSIAWVVSRTALPYLAFMITFHNCLLVLTSRPDDGSSNIRTLGLQHNAIDMDRRLFIPPESFLLAISIWSWSSTDSSRS